MDLNLLTNDSLESLEEDGPAAVEDLPHLVKFLTELSKSNSTWYAPVDC